MSAKERQGFITAVLILISLTVALLGDSIAAAICFCGLIYDIHNKKEGER